MNSNWFTPLAPPSYDYAIKIEGDLPVPAVESSWGLREGDRTASRSRLVVAGGTGRGLSGARAGVVSPGFAPDRRIAPRESRHEAVPRSRWPRASRCWRPRRSADVTFEYIFDGGYPLSVSNDGSVVAGNLANGELRRVPLDAGHRAVRARARDPRRRRRHDRACPPTARGSPRPSGRPPTACTATQGLWTLGSGWQELMPPLPPDGGTMTAAIGSAWEISGDGTTVVGLYWRAGLSATAPTPRSGRRRPASSTWADDHRPGQPRQRRQLRRLRRSSAGSRRHRPVAPRRMGQRLPRAPHQLRHYRRDALRHGRGDDRSHNGDIIVGF